MHEMNFEISTVTEQSHHIQISTHGEILASTEAALRLGQSFGDLYNPLEHR